MNTMFRPLLLMVLMALVLPGCSTNPATGRSQFNMMSEQQEISIGQQSAPEFLQSYGGPIPSPEIRAYVSDLGMRLASQSERAELPWEFHVVDSPVINAFALPGGKVFMSRGLLSKMTNEAQLAGVLGHEIAHVTAQHIGQQMSRAAGVQVLGAVLGTIGDQSDTQWMQVLGVGSTVGGSLYLLKFGRDQETEADILGLRYMTRLGYNPAAQLQVMDILKAASGGGGGVEFLATHPAPQTRIDRIEAHIRKEYPDFEDVAQYAFHADRFQREVLSRLATLPPPKHNPQAQAQQQQKQLQASAPQGGRGSRSR